MFKHITLIIILLITIFDSHAASDLMELSFKNFTYNDKLPSNSVKRIYHDKEGYLWFGTKDGLCRFDGYDIKIFRSSASAPNRLTNNEIKCISEDQDGRLWIGTSEGINIIDKKNYSVKPLNNKYFIKENINSILTDTKGYVWIGTSTHGVLKMDTRTGKYERFSTDKNSKFRLKGNQITNIYEDRSGRIWISLWKKGLSYIDPSRKHIVFTNKIGENNNPFRIYQDKDGLFWICTWGDGIFNMKVNANEKIDWHPMVLSKNSDKKVDNIVYSITQDDKNGYIWVVTFSGLNLIRKEADGSFKVIDTKSFFDATASNLFHEIIKDRQGNLWLGSDGEGLYNLDFNKLSIQNYPLNDIKSSLNIQPCVTNFIEMKNGEVYIAINRIGLFNFNSNTGGVKRAIDPTVRSIKSISAAINISYSNEVWVANEGEDRIHILKKNAENNLVQIQQFSLSKSTRPKEINITGLFEDSKKNIWIGTNIGLYLKPFKSAIKLISSKIRYISTMGEDINKRIWIGTEKDGVFVCKPETSGKKSSYTFLKVNLNNNKYQSNSVQSICCKQNGEVYIGTREGCLYFFNQKTHIAKDISALYGITDVEIMDIIEDDYGMLWISTIKKIIRYNPKTHAATYFSTSDGMLVSSFFKNARIKLKSGQILFGGNKGISSFNPGSLTTLPTPAKQHVAISDIQIQNKSIFDDKLNSHFNDKKNRVTSKFSENNLSIEFSALDYSSASKIQYAYMLSGIDNNWNYIGNNRRFVNYANLPAGKYKFLVKASDENGLWSDQITSLEVVILPPPYRTWWAYLIYLAILAAVAYFFTRTTANRIRSRTELRISKIDQEKSEELNQTKLRYFTNISHELLTPLTIISCLIEDFNNNFPNKFKQYSIMKSNVTRLKRLLQQILDFKKVESGKMKLHVTEKDLILFINDICWNNFEPLVKEKNIQFSITSPDKIMAWFDDDKLDKVLFNILSNAFKYTPVNGTINLTVQPISKNETEYVKIFISDTGSGISAEMLPFVFDRFFGNEMSKDSNGIGLSLTKELVEIQKGTIVAESQINVGTTFTVEIPIDSKVFKLDVSNNGFSETSLSPAITMEEGQISSFTQHPIAKNNDILILIVEDNVDLLMILANSLSRFYRVLKAKNGLKALTVMKENEIDLLISDVMMPEMDGITLCKAIKGNIEFSHTPVLLLTAKNQIADRIDCYNAGADAYISKPFEMEVLEARINSLILNRQKKNKEYQSSLTINPKNYENDSIDDLFLREAIRIVEENLANFDFTHDQLIEAMKTSKSTLYRKIKSLTGLSPSEFVRNIRLKHSCLMLKNDTGNISDIAYAVGFNDPKYFSTCFKTEFGVSPRDYMKEQTSVS